MKKLLLISLCIVMLQAAIPAPQLNAFPKVNLTSVGKVLLYSGLVSTCLLLPFRVLHSIQRVNSPLPSKSYQFQRFLEFTADIYFLSAFTAEVGALTILADYVIKHDPTIPKSN